MNMNYQIFDRYFLFLSATFFVDYWVLLSGTSFASSVKSVIQSASREAVADFMGSEEIYWNIDFSSERHERSIANFAERLKPLSDHDRIHHDMMQQNFCEDEQEQINITFTLSFLHQILSNPEFRAGSGLKAEDVEVISACIPSGQDLELNTYQLQTDWLNSDSTWDRKIRGYTPDLPEYVWSNFNNAYRKFVRFPIFINNLSQLLTVELKIAFLKRLAEAIINQFPEDSSLDVPSLIRNAA